MGLAGIGVRKLSIIACNGSRPGKHLHRTDDPPSRAPDLFTLESRHMRHLPRPARRGTALTALVTLVAASLPAWPAATPCPLGHPDRLLYLKEGLRSDRARAEPVPDALLRDLPRHFDPVDVIPYDLDGDGRPEHLVRSGERYSGGTLYLVMAARPKGRWRQIGMLQGGFNLASRDGLKASQHVRIETWSRHGGQIVHTFYTYRRGRYVVDETLTWPKEFDLAPPPFDR